MMKPTQIPIPTHDQSKQVEVVFMKQFGIAPRKFRKDVLAFMIVNQSSNVNKNQWEAEEVTKIGMAMKRQRDWYLKLIRNKSYNNKYDDITIDNVSPGTDYTIDLDGEVN